MQRSEKHVDSLISCSHSPLQEGAAGGQGKELPFILARGCHRLPGDMPFLGAVGRKYPGMKARVRDPSELEQQRLLCFVGSFEKV